MIKDKTLDSILEEREHLKLLSVTSLTISNLHTYLRIFVLFHFIVGFKLAQKFH